MRYLVHFAHVGMSLARCPLFLHFVLADLPFSKCSPHIIFWSNYQHAGFEAELSGLASTPSPQKWSS